jgi:hypothetical protein
VLLAACAAVAMAGPDRYSLDAGLGIALPGFVGAAGLAAVVAGWATAMIFSAREHPRHAAAHH